ncbi:MAG: aminoglycoside phosphotransferase family protein [Arthrobacter sp.]|nr:aminoglycoside phosphotransferase family protein [Arthrobacter sp.]
MTRAPLPSELALARRLDPAPAWAEGFVEEGGDDHLVLVPGAPAPGGAPGVVLRLARRPEVASELGRRMALLSALAPHLPWLSPEPLSDVVLGDDAAPAAVLQRFVSGGAHAPHEGDPAALRGVLEALAAVPTAAWESLVTGPYVSSAPWDPAGREAVLGVLPAEARRAAEAVWAGLEGIEGEATGLVHGDLAGHNMRWKVERLVGVIDWDHAAAWDPAINLSHLALWHGVDVVAPAAPDARFAARAALWVGHHALFRLRRAAEDGAVRRWERLLRKTLPRLDFAATAGAGEVLA